MSTDHAGEAVLQYLQFVDQLGRFEDGEVEQPAVVRPILRRLSEDISDVVPSPPCPGADRPEHRRRSARHRDGDLFAPMSSPMLRAVVSVPPRWCAIRTGSVGAR
jgi:hypothetical protein